MFKRLTSQLSKTIDSNLRHHVCASWQNTCSTHWIHDACISSIVQQECVGDRTDRSHGSHRSIPSLKQELNSTRLFGCCCCCQCFEMTEMATPFESLWSLWHLQTLCNACASPWQPWQLIFEADPSTLFQNTGLQSQIDCHRCNIHFWEHLTQKPSSSSFLIDWCVQIISVFAWQTERGGRGN